MNEELVMELIAALREQTEAISALADSNQQILNYLMHEEVAEDADRPGPTYLDGTPCR